MKHLTVGVGIGVVAADDFTGARERRLGHVVVIVIGRTTDGAQRRIHAPAQHAQCQQTYRKIPKKCNVISPDRESGIIQSILKSIKRIQRKWE